MTTKTHPRSVLVEDGLAAGHADGWHCDCVCGWTSRRLRLADQTVADRVATLHLRVCRLLHP